MPDIEPRIWLLPNGDVCKLIDGQYRHWDGGVGIDWPSDGSIVDRIGYYDELPKGAVPLVAVPKVEVHREGGYIVRDGSTGGYRYTLERTDDQIDYLTMELGRVLAVRELLERESTSAEAARRKVLRDLKPGVYNLSDEMGNGIVEWGAGEVEDHITDRVRTVPHDICKNEADARAGAELNDESVMQRYTHDWRVIE